MGPFMEYVMYNTTGVVLCKYNIALRVGEHEK